MFNKRLITIFLALLVFHSTNAVVMDKADVLKINPATKENNICPSPGATFTSPDTCLYDFLCLGEKCYSSENAIYSGFVFVSEGTQKKKLFFNGACKTNEDCLTNKCVGNVCDKTGVEECTVPRNATAIHCGIPSLESCQTNEECASGVCIENKCELVYQKEIEDLISLLKSSVFVIICIILCCCCCIGGCIFAFCRRRKTREPNMV